MTDTPDSLRLHIGIFGRTNSGKSSLLNMITGQNCSIVSGEEGTTADPVNKYMEIAGLGPVVFTDTAGFCDESELGKKRIEKTDGVLRCSDIILALFSAEDFCNDTELGHKDYGWVSDLLKADRTFIPVVTKTDAVSLKTVAAAKKRTEELTGVSPVCVSTFAKEGCGALIEKIRQVCAEISVSRTFTGGLCKKGDTVLLVMPQDIQAPKGRLILPQVQVMRELLDKKCVVVSCTADMLEHTLSTLIVKPGLIITDSQVLSYVNSLKPESCAVTSFSVLMAAFKGDIKLFLKGAEAIKKLTSCSRVLIAESCTHVPQEEDIGRVKIPFMLNRIAPGIEIDFVRGKDFPSKLAGSDGKPLYDLIIHCGACMFNRAYMLYRQNLAHKAGIPMTNYGIAIAAVKGILEEVSVP